MAEDVELATEESVAASSSDGDSVQFFKITTLSGTGSAYLNGLKRGDVIVAVDGRVNRHNLSDLLTGIRVRKDQETLVTYIRNGVLFSVFVTGYLGLDAEVATPDAIEECKEIIDREGLIGKSGCRPYSVYINRENKCEIRDNTPSLLALVFPPFWMLSQRYVEGMVGCIMVYVVCAVINFWLFVLVYCAFSYSVWREQKKFVDMFLLRMGYRPYMRLAGYSEEYLQLSLLKDRVELDFMYPSPEALDYKEKHMPKDPDRRDYLS